MSTLNTEELRSACQAEIMPGVRDQITKASWLWKRLYGEKSAKNKYRAATALSKLLDYEYKEPDLTTGRGDVVVPVYHYAKKQMTVEYTYMVGNILLSDKEILSNKSNAIVDITKDAIEKATKGMKVKAGQLIFTGNGTVNPKEPNGLEVVINDSNTWAGIDRTIYEWFQSPTIDSGDRPWTRTEIDQMWSQLTTGLDEAPTIQITSPELWLKARTVLMDADKTLPSHKGLAESGLENYIMNNSLVTKDIYCPSKTWIHLNENVTKMYVEPDMDMYLTEILPVAFQPHDYYAYIKFAWVLWCAEPRLNGIHKGLTVS